MINMRKLWGLTLIQNNIHSKNPSLIYAIQLMLRVQNVQKFFTKYYVVHNTYIHTYIFNIIIWYDSSCLFAYIFIISRVWLSHFGLFNN